MAQLSDPFETEPPVDLSQEDASCTGTPYEAGTTPKKGHRRNGADACRGAEQSRSARREQRQSATVTEFQSEGAEGLAS